MKRFRWKGKQSRSACVAATVIRALLERLTVEEALGKSLDKYCENGDLITRFEQDWILEDVRAGLDEAREQAKAVKKAM